MVCPSQKDAKVLIFGAGAAGVTAARILHDSGVTNIKILEAHNEIGGRIRNKPFGSVWVEVGANWIHEAPQESASGSGMNVAAEGNNPIWRLARGDVCPKLTGIYTYDNKAIFKNKQVNGQYETANAGKEIEAYMNAYNALPKTPETDDCNIGRTVRKGLDDQGWKPDTQLEKLVEWSDFDFTYGTTPDKSSLYYTAKNHNVEFGKDCYIVTHQQGLGFASILQCLAEPFKAGTISRNVEVDSIDWNNECVCAKVTGQDRMCADYGIVTFSIGVLQDWLESKPSRFIGSLSSEKMKAITNSKMGLYLKIFVKFSNTFWETNAHYIYFTNEMRGYYPVIQPIGAALPGEPPIMLMTVTGEEAKHLSDLTKEEIKMEILTVE